MAIHDSLVDVCAYKLMQARGYEKLSKKAKDERMRNLLIEISKNEAKDTEYLSQELQKLSVRGSKRTKEPFLTRYVGLMMGILGPRGLFEWAIIAEDESVENLALHAENIGNVVASEKWIRIAADERLHIERMKKEILGMEGWEMGSGGGVRDVIFGANDGLVSILALVAGVYGATTESYPILIAGVAGAVAGAISMGAGAYLSAKSEKEVTERERERKGIKSGGSPERERERLTKFYQSKGFDAKEAKAIAMRVSSTMESDAEFTIGEEIGLTSEESWPPGKAAILTGLSFAIFSSIPILPFTFMDVTPAVITAMIASIVALFVVGASKVIFTRKNWTRSGIEMMMIGTLASLATYLIGLLIPV